jgi:hypothetical protein
MYFFVGHRDGIKAEEIILESFCDRHSVAV